MRVAGKKKNRHFIENEAYSISPLIRRCIARKRREISFIILPFQAGPPGKPAINTAVAVTVPAGNCRAPDMYLPFPVTIDAPRAFAMGTAHLLIGHW